MHTFARIIFIFATGGLSSILDAASVRGYFDLGTSCQWFDARKVRAIMQGADNHILIDAQRGEPRPEAHQVRERSVS